ncbi:MAG: T9SS type A sorting domain-containing protein [Bacteroidales bacterium]|nr:T9SS type A sorting domain-containing protein [Bacteroidales bacterium]
MTLYYPISLNVNATSTPIAGNTAAIQGDLVYVYDSDKGQWNNNLQTTTGKVTKIKPSEGFFIAAVDASGNFIFDKSINPSNAKSTYKSNLIYVNATANNETREAFLQMNEDAENGFDFNDGLMMFGSNGNAVEPFFRINAGKEAFDSEIGDLNILKDAFSTLPYMTELDLRSEKENDLSLNFSNIPSDIHVYLLDSVLNTAQYLNENADYSLKVSAGDNKNRLFVLFSYNKEDINQFFKPEMAEEIRIWNYNNTLHIEGKNLIRYEVYDILGNKIFEEQTLEDDYQKSLSLKNGIYIARAYSKVSTKTEKISINN